MDGIMFLYKTADISPYELNLNFGEIIYMINLWINIHVTFRGVIGTRIWIEFNNFKSWEILKI